MATTTLIAAGTTAATSADFTVAAASQIALFLIPAAAGQITDDCYASIQYKSGSDYTTIGTVGQEGIKLTAPGTYRVTRDLTGVSFGVVSEA